MGWVWRDEEEGEENSKRKDTNAEICTTRKIVQSKCNTEEVEPGIFIRKCEKTEQLLRDCVGKPTEIVQSNKEYTEEDVTNEMKKGSSALSSDLTGPFDFPGLRSDIEAIERSVFGGISRFFEAADEMRNEFSRFMDDSPVFGKTPSSTGRQDIPYNSESGDVDLSGMARDV